jgi:site-specific DNA recombinase
MVPLAGIEPALLAELDFESSASTNSATGARTCDVP